MILALKMVMGCLLAIPIMGCGPSQQELMMRSAQRSRGGGEEEEVRRTPPPQQAVVESASAQKTPTDVPKPAAQPVEIRSGEAIPEIALKTIGERTPEQPLTNDARRKQAHDNLVSVSEALLAYARDKKRLPGTYFESNGFRTLSWRVELLPYLGHQELHDKFDKTVPWNRSPNKELLAYIPDQYVSPERFDTKTNIVMPARDGMIAAERGRARPEHLEDGQANTLMLVEVNDSLAVEWSAPEDFAPENPREAKRGLVGLRRDGGFAVWANGWPVMLAKELGDRVFWNALTKDAGDGQLAGSCHRDIALKNVSEASVTSLEAGPADETVEVAIDSKQYEPPAEIVTAIREQVPLAVELAKVQTRFRGLFAEKMREARSSKEKTDLAKELLQTATEMPKDPVGCYALQTAAMRLAIEGGSIETLVKAIDQRIGKFEVDAYEVNKRWLLAFGKGVLEKSPEEINGTEYTKRSVKVIYAGIHDDDYVDSLSIGRYAFRLIDQRPDDPIAKYLTQLRGLLGSAKREFTAVADALDDYRINPENTAAASTVGRYMCFIKGDWKRGLPLLVEGGPADLQEVAKLDIRGAADAINKTAIGDAWWRLSERARTGVYRQSSRDRAVFWYEQAYVTMPDSLDRLHVKARMAEAEEAPPSSPLALVTELASELSVNLEYSLAAVADVGQRSSAREGGTGGAEPFRVHGAAED
ncbi:MAG: DUF1559 domain-containing protein [Rubripirellula sp.]